MIYFIILYLTVTLITLKVLKQRDRKLDLKKYELDLSYGTNPIIEQQLNSLISSVFDEYRIYNLDYNDEYINEKDTENIIKDISDLVLERISQPFFMQLTTYYNNKSIGKIIATKINLLVNEYRLNKNRPK